MLICGGITLSFREDRKIHVSFTGGIGPELSADVSVGTSIGASEGWSLNGGCSGAYGLGAYVSGGLASTYDMQSFTREYSWGGGSGYVLGMGAGCSAGSSYTLRF